MINAIFDLNDGWRFEGEEELNFGITITDGDAERIYPDRLLFGYQILVNGELAESVSLPPSYEVIRELTPTCSFLFQVNALFDDEIVLKFWCSHSGNAPVYGETSFTVPRPPQPYPSWTWGGEWWEPPVPYPDDGGYYEWDEDAQQWATVDPISEQGDN